MTVAFALRVVLQPLALITTRLPAFDSWHSAVLPYPVLLASQLAILAAMSVANLACMRGVLGFKPRLARVLAVLGTVYFLVMATRLVLGLTLATPPAWFTYRLPAAFHLVLSGWLLLLARVLTKHAD